MSGEDRRPYVAVPAGPAAWKVVATRPVGAPEQVVAAAFAVPGIDPGEVARRLAAWLNGEGDEPGGSEAPEGTGG